MTNPDPFSIRTYKELSRSEQTEADRVTTFTYELLDLWDKVLAVKFEADPIKYHGQPFLFATWGLMFNHRTLGKIGGVELMIDLRLLNDPHYREYLYRKVVNDYATLIYGWEMQNRLGNDAK